MVLAALSVRSGKICDRPAGWLVPESAARVGGPARATTNTVLCYEIGMCGSVHGFWLRCGEGGFLLEEATERPGRSSSPCRDNKAVCLGRLRAHAQVSFASPAILRAWHHANTCPGTLAI